MPLTEVRSGNRVCIESIDLPPATQRRLGELGLMPGEELRVIRNQSPCPVVIGLGPAQLMLGRDMGLKIHVLSSRL